MRIILFFGAFFILSACDNDGNLGMEGSPVWKMQHNKQGRLDYFERKCSEYGLKSGTIEMSQCIAEESRNVSAISRTTRPVYCRRVTYYTTVCN